MYREKRLIVRAVLKLVLAIALVISCIFLTSNLITIAKANCNVHSGVITDKYIRNGFLGLGGTQCYYVVVEYEYGKHTLFGDTGTKSIAVSPDEYEKLVIDQNYSF